MTKEGNERLYILDGHSLAYRAFFALPLELTTGEGLHTNAVLGFTNMLLRLLKDESPSHLIVAFDYPAPTFRHDLYVEYKATREKTPPEMSEQLPLIREILAGFQIPFYELEGYEADDLIGTLVRLAAEVNLSPVIVTADADAYQLLEPGVEIMITRRGISQVERYNGAKLEADYGLTPRQWIDFKALKGDSSDNIPGIPGVGEKRALQLLHKYGSLEEILEHSGEIKGKLGENIAASAEQARLGKELVTINRQVPLEMDLMECRYRGPDRDTLLPVLRRLEMNGVIRSLEQSGVLSDIQAGPHDENKEKIDGKDKASAGAVASLPPSGSAVGGGEVRGERMPDPPRLVQTEKELDELVSQLEKQDDFAALLDQDAEAGSQERGLFLSPDLDETYYLPLDGRFYPAKEVLKRLQPLLLDGKKALITHDYKPLYKLLAGLGIEPACTVHDTLLAAYLLEPDRPSYELRTLCCEQGGYALPENGKGRRREEEKEAARELELAVQGYCCSELFFLMDSLFSRLQEQELTDLFFKLELPLVRVLARMEMEGITVKKEVLQRLAVELSEQLNSLEQEIMELAGEEFNLNSPRQLSQILFEKLKLPVVRRIKTGYSTDAQALQELAAHHPIADKLVRYRTLAKLINTYLEGLPPLINKETGRIHTTFNQAVTATGRLSSRDPNLQNIPIRYDEGKRLREAFTVSQEGNLLLAADYSQIELRIMAHLSGDGELVDAFRKDQDIHTRTAAGVFGVAMDEVTSRMRGVAKAVNFGIIYGISDYGLARDLQIPRGEARQYIKDYFERYSGIRDYIESCIATARQKGYVTTLMGRRRYIPDLKHPNHNRRSFAERVARNTPIQGSAADLIKAAMVDVDRELAKKGSGAVMLLQVHDELIFELPAGELEEVARLVKSLMEGILSLKVPLKVDLKRGRDWYHMDPMGRC